MAHPPAGASRLARFAGNLVWSIGGTAALAALSFLLLPWLVAGLGVEGYALYALMGTLSSYLLLLTMGAGNSVVKFVSELAGRGDRTGLALVLRAALWVHTVPVLLGSLALYRARGWAATAFLSVPPGLEAAAAAAVACAAAAAVFASLIQLAVSHSAGRQLFARAMAVQTLQAGLTLGGAVGLVRLGYGVRAACVLYVAVNVALCAAVLGPVWREADIGAPPASGTGPPAGALRGFFSYSFQTFLAQLAWSVTFQWDKAVIGARLPISELAYYMIPAMILQKLWVLPSSVMVSVFPMLSEMQGRGEEAALGRAFRQLSQLILWLVVPGFVFLVVLAPQVLSLWLRADFSEHGVWPLRLLALGYFFHMLGAMPTTASSGRGRPGFVLAWQAAQALLCAAGWALFIPRWGIAGAALSFALAQALPTVPYVLVVGRRLFGMSASEYATGVLARPLAAGAALLAALWPLRELATGWIPLTVMCGFASAAYYGVGLAILGEPERESLRRMRAAFAARLGLGET